MIRCDFSDPERLADFSIFHMADNLGAFLRALTTSLFQVVNRFVASLLCKPALNRFAASSFNKL